MKTLGWIALGGIGIGIVTFSMAASIAKDTYDFGNLGKMFRHGHRGDCSGVAATVNGSEARFAWDGSDHVAIAVPGRTRWKRGEGTEVILRGDADDLERIRLDDGSLQVCGDIDDEVEITLPGQSFRKVVVAGAGELSMEDVDQPELELMLAGAGRVDARGTSDKVKVTIAGAGEARIGKLATKRLDLDIMGAGKAEASPEDDAAVRIMGAGKVDLLTRPKRHDFNVMGAGDVKMPDET